MSKNAFIGKILPYSRQLVIATPVWRLCTSQHTFSSTSLRAHEQQQERKRNSNRKKSNNREKLITGRGVVLVGAALALSVCGFVVHWHYTRPRPGVYVRVCDRCLVEVDDRDVQSDGLLEWIQRCRQCRRTGFVIDVPCVSSCAICERRINARWRTPKWTLQPFRAEVLCAHHIKQPEVSPCAMCQRWFWRDNVQDAQSVVPANADKNRVRLRSESICQRCESSGVHDVSECTRVVESVRAFLLTDVHLRVPAASPVPVYMSTLRTVPLSVESKSTVNIGWITGNFNGYLSVASGIGREQLQFEAARALGRVCFVTRSGSRHRWMPELENGVCDMLAHIYVRAQLRSLLDAAESDSSLDASIDEWRYLLRSQEERAFGAEADWRVALRCLRGRFGGNAKALVDYVIQNGDFPKPYNRIVRYKVIKRA